MKNELILILDFGGQYNQLIARRVRECNVYSEVVPYNISIEKIKEKSPKGIIFTGGPSSVYSENAPKCDARIFELGIPILGICYGMQLMTNVLGGSVKKAKTREYGATEVNIDTTSPLFKGFESNDNRMLLVDEYGAFKQSKRQVSGTNKSNALAKSSSPERRFVIYYKNLPEEDLKLLED